MNQSESVKEIATALSKAQGEMQGAIRDSTNPFFHSTYADLSSVWDACREPLVKHGLSVIQAGEFEGGVVMLRTTLYHSSGEWVSGVLPIKPVKDDPQGMGSALTYARRYGLMAMVGISPEDDDGNAASQKGDERKQTYKRKQEPAKEAEVEMVGEREGQLNSAHRGVEREDKVVQQKGATNLESPPPGQSSSKGVGMLASLMEGLLAFHCGIPDAKCEECRHAFLEKFYKTPSLKELSDNDVKVIRGVMTTKKPEKSFQVFIDFGNQWAFEHQIEKKKSQEALVEEGFGG